jgi:fumarate reductase subunit D
MSIRRSNKPIFWSLFGAGGMLSALIGPALVFTTGIAVPLDWLISRNAMSYDRVHAFAASGFGKIAIAAVISLFLFHGCHRMYHALHDFGVHVGPGLKAAFHGFAIVGTAVTVWLLFIGIT